MMGFSSAYDKGTEPSFADEVFSLFDKAHEKLHYVCVENHIDSGDRKVLLIKIYSMTTGQCVYSIYSHFGDMDMVYKVRARLKEL